MQKPDKRFDMAYNKLNYLNRVVEMQKTVLTLMDEHKGLPLTRIYHDYIKDRFFISYSTFNRWLGIPAKKELEELKNQSRSE